MPNRLSVRASRVFALFAFILLTASRAATGSAGECDQQSGPDCNASGVSDQCEVPPLVFDAGQRYRLGSSGASVAAGDLDRDGAPDVVVGAHNNVLVLHNTGNGTFAPPVTYPRDRLDAKQVIIADVTGDAVPDVIIANRFWRGVIILRNNGSGGLTPLRELEFMYDIPSVTVADFDGDTDLDVAALEQGFRSGIHLLRNDGAGVFAAAGTVAASWGLFLTATDFDSDGDIDLAGLNSGIPDALVLVRNRGNADFVAVDRVFNERVAVAVELADLSGDGRADVVIANGVSHSVSLARARADSGFDAAQHIRYGAAETFDSERIRLATDDPLTSEPGRCGCGVSERVCGTPSFTRTPTATRTANPTSATPTPTRRLRRATFVVDTGGGVRNGTEFASGTLTIDRVTIGDNGGEGVLSTGTALVMNTTGSRNRGRYAGGISNSGIADAAQRHRQPQPIRLRRRRYP